VSVVLQANAQRNAIVVRPYQRCIKVVDFHTVHIDVDGTLIVARSVPGMRSLVPVIIVGFRRATKPSAIIAASICTSIVRSLITSIGQAKSCVYVEQYQ